MLYIAWQIMLHTCSIKRLKIDSKFILIVKLILRANHIIKLKQLLEKEIQIEEKKELFLLILTGKEYSHGDSRYIT